MSVHVDFTSRFKILSTEKQMRGPTILWIDLQDKVFHRRASIALDNSPFSPIAFVLLKNEWCRLRRIIWLLGSVRRRSRVMITAKQY
jgi:hypothetical protein